jgi:hypothetical protein
MVLMWRDAQRTCRPRLVGGLRMDDILGGTTLVDA